jgi:predicted ATPase
VRVMAHRCMGVCLHWTGDCAGALEQFDAVIALYDPERDRPLAAILGFDVRVQTALLACWDLLILGRPDQAAQRFALFRSELHDVHHKHSQLFALAFGAVFSLLMQDREAAFEQLTEALALAAEQRFTHVGAWTRLILAAQFTVLNDAEAGLAQARYSYETYVAATGASQAGTGLVLNATYFLGLLAQACEAAGAEDEAGSLLDRALDGARRSGEGWFEPELHRLKAEWLLHHVPETEARAEAAFGRAIDLAERRKALLWVLRSTVSLARLYRAQGRLSMAREVLTRATGRFSEGQHWPELVGAKALLADLSS